MKQKLLAGMILAALGNCQALAHGTEPEMENHWTAPDQAARRHNIVKLDQASLTRGQALFTKHCSGCHGENGVGDGPSGSALDPKPSNLKEMSAHHSDGDLAWKIAHGRGPMPGWKGTLRPKQIWDLVNYIRRLGEL